MGTRHISIDLELPDELLAVPGAEARIARRVRQGVVMDLLRAGQLSQGKAAELLHVDRWKLVDIMNEHDVPFFNVTGLDLGEQVESLRRLRSRKPA